MLIHSLSVYLPLYLSLSLAVSPSLTALALISRIRRLQPPNSKCKINAHCACVFGTHYRNYAHAHTYTNTHTHTPAQPQIFAPHIFTPFWLLVSGFWLLVACTAHLIEILNKPIKIKITLALCHAPPAHCTDARQLIATGTGCGIY